MGTSCNPFQGRKTYDNRFKVGSCPFNKFNGKYWYCDPNCKPKKGDWVGFWIALKKQLTSDEIDSIFNTIESVARELDLIVDCLEYSAGLLTDIKFIVGFKNDSDKTLHELMFDHFCKAFNNECNLSYDQREYIDWINFMGMDGDLAILEVKWENNRVPLDEPIRITITNYGRVNGQATIYGIDSIGIMKGCTYVTIPAGQTKKYKITVNKKQDASQWQVAVVKYKCLECSTLPVDSNNMIVVEEESGQEQPPSGGDGGEQPPSGGEQPPEGGEQPPWTIPGLPIQLPPTIFGIPTEWVLVGVGVLTLVGAIAYYEEKKREEMMMMLLLAR